MRRRQFLRNVSLGATALQLRAGLSPKRSSAAESPGGLICQSVRDLGPQFLDNPLNITGQDGATSCRLPSGDSFWFFGDTIEGPFETIRNHDLTEVLSNTASIVPQQDCSAGIGKFEYLKSVDDKRPRQVIEFDEQEDKSIYRLWPIHSTCVDKFIYAFYHKITMDPERDVFETFQLNGMGIARAVIGEYDFERLTAPDGSKEFWKGNEPGFGVFVEQSADGYLYLWGCFWTGMFLARTRPETIADLGSYEYLVQAPSLANRQATPVWSQKHENAAVLFDSVPNELSVAYNPYLKQHLAIHVVGRQNKLALRTAPRITGPWSQPEVFFTPPQRTAGDLFTAAKEHPEMQQEGGKVLYVTYVNSSEYVPNLLKVTLA